MNQSHHRNELQKVYGRRRGGSGVRRTGNRKGAWSWACRALWRRSLTCTAVALTPSACSFRSASCLARCDVQVADCEKDLKAHINDEFHCQVIPRCRLLHVQRRLYALD